MIFVQCQLLNNLDTQVCLVITRGLYKLRRHFLTVSATMIGDVLVYPSDRKAFRISAEDKALRFPTDFF